ncbi:protein arginine N-methyltransferase 2-like [Rhopilema esculentum]|uniref:protein arginine N-methyltransferase 2-like n=1 Tax=Rhopilema esculentum TaxID=499914 RepID=UPI0031D18DA2|eukprot:gene3211-1526_t
MEAGETNKEIEQILHPKKVILNGQKVEALNDCFQACAVYDYSPKSDVELDLIRGDVLKIHEKTSEDWWWGEKDGAFGYIPVNHISTNFCKSGTEDWQDEHYYEIYSNIPLQLEMLSDKPRTLSYLKAIEENKNFINGKSVMDVGCGTGILSLFLAKHGNAAKVFAVEASGASRIAESVVEFNGYHNKIQVLGKRVEDIETSEKMDLIISEWMGTLLLSEFMIDSVINARDKFLKPEGKIWPSTASLYFAPCSSNEEFQSKVTFWNDVYGFDFSEVKQIALEQLTKKPLHNNITNKQNLLANPEKIAELNMYTVAVEDIENIVSHFTFKVESPGLFDSFCTWFCVEFENFSKPGEKNIVLDTSPDAEITHWKHPLLLLDETTNVVNGDVISGTIQLKRNEKLRRHMSLKLNVVITRSSEVLTQFEKEFKCWE